MSETTSKIVHHHGWDFDKRISLGNVLTVVVIAASFFAYVSKMDRRIDLLEQRVEIEVQQRKETQAISDHRFETDRAEARQERKEITQMVNDGFATLNDKIDRLVRKRE